MPEVLVFESTVLLVVLLISVAVKGFAFINALLWPAEAYHAAGKLTKNAWLVILGVGLAAQIILIGQGPLNLINLAAAIAALVYVLDVRPAMAGLRRR